ncbi:MAG TPA: IMP cyclohydrolase [Candidatus Hydrogenedentes bacterium]|nr:IMP cyclohydrolase [Candidatus Hydrogenedentota bacterium]HPG70196.1 IMP cyclohydrolase [Candidatus Hydrogenedentota bacterium]
MYIGRIVSVAQTKNGDLCASYRVSSRSFPNRTAVVREGAVSIVPKPGFEADVYKNPYIAYNCVRLVCGDQVAVVTNGSHTDPIAEKMEQGMPARDALVLSMLALDFEKDQYNTPRISAVVDRRGTCAGWLGVVRDDGLEVRRMPLGPGRFFYVATYEENSPQDAYGGEYTAATADEACTFILGEDVFAERTNAVTAVAAMASGGGFELATRDAVE